MENYENWILMFNFETLKWSDVEISVKRPKNMFIDTNDVLTLHVGNQVWETKYTYESFRAFYRFALR